MEPAIVVRPNFTLLVCVVKKLVIQDNSCLRCMAAPFILVAIIDVDDSFVVLARVTLDLDDAAAGASLN